MNKRLVSAFAVIICMAIMTVAAMTVSATGENESESSNVSVSSSEQTGTISSEAQTSSDVTDSESSSDKTESESSSEVQTSSKNDTSSGKETSSEESNSGGTSSTGTTSRKPIHSGGGHGGSTFIDQDGSDLASQNAGTTVTSSEAELISSDYSEGTDEEIHNPFIARAVSAADDIYRIIWIPIVIAVLCIGGLVAVNIMFRKKYPKKSASGASRRSKGESHSHQAPRRRR